MERIQVRLPARPSQLLPPTSGASGKDAPGCDVAPGCSDAEEPRTPWALLKPASDVLPKTKLEHLEHSKT